MVSHRKSYFLIVLIIIIGISVFDQVIAQSSHSHTQERVIELPDIPGYKTLLCDFHQHTVFSDGNVWPSIRVREAIRDGLDAISITEHLEYQPHSKDIPHPDRNRSYQIALKEAENKDIIIVNGSEITRKMPPGHINAIFIDDANKLIKDDVISVLREAKKQDAFVFWNHPNWVSQNKSGIAELTKMHHQLIDEELINGIEIVNEHTYSVEALEIAIQNDLTIMGNSDIHGLIDWEFNVGEGGHRPITIVFAKEKSEEALKEGLVNRRTAVFFDNTLVGDSKFLVPLISESLYLETDKMHRKNKENSLIKSVYIKNRSDVDYILENQSDFSFHTHSDIINIAAHGTAVIKVKTSEVLSAFDLKFKVLNAFIGPNKHPEITFKIAREEN